MAIRVKYISQVRESWSDLLRTLCATWRKETLLLNTFMNDVIVRIRY